MKILVLGLSLLPFPVGGFPFSLALQGPIQLQLALSVCIQDNQHFWVLDQEPSATSLQPALFSQESLAVLSQE